VPGLGLRITEIIAPGQVFTKFRFVETNVNQVRQSAFDPISREPNYKQFAVKVEHTKKDKQREETGGGGQRDGGRGDGCISETWWAAFSTPSSST